MDKPHISTDEQRLSELKQRFKQWRATKTSRGERIPEALWSEALALSEVFSHNRLCRELHLGSHDLKKRLGIAVPERNKRQRTQSLALVDVTEAVTSTVWRSPSPAELLIERRDGTRLQLSYSGSVAEFSPLVAQFLSQL